MTNYGFQIKDNGVGVYAENTNTSTGTINVRYTGSATAVGTGAYFKESSKLILPLFVTLELDAKIPKPNVFVFFIVIFPSFVKFPSFE